MNQQLFSLKKELDEILAPLSNAPGLYDLVIESLSATGRGLAPHRHQEIPWPLLPLLVSQSVCGEWERALPLAASIQLLLAAGDVFDDIEDADCPHSVFAKHGLAISTNVATTLLILAERALTRSTAQGLDDGKMVRLIGELNSFFTIACVGQHLDLLYGVTSSLTEKAYLDIIEMKSASQIECSCRLGAILATPNPEIINILSVFGFNLGMAAQISNDLLGITQGKDIDKRKMSLPVIFAFTHADERSKAYLENAYRLRMEPTVDSDHLKNILFSTGAMHYSTLKLEYYKQKAIDALAQASSLGVSINNLGIFLENEDSISANQKV